MKEKLARIWKGLVHAYKKNSGVHPAWSHRGSAQDDHPSFIWKTLNTVHENTSMITGIVKELVFGAVYDGYKTILTHWIEPDKP